MMVRLFSVTVVLICAVFHLVSADFRKGSLDLHNQYRAKHGSPPLALSAELNNFSQNWAQKMAKSNRLSHSSGKYGENIYMTSNTKLSDSEAAIEATAQWYGENSKYNYRYGTFASSTGHFTQIVWKNSNFLGIGVARSSRGVFVCANYDPQGNISGQFVQNVLKPKLN